MATYPAQASLKAKLKEVCTSDAMCETLSVKFGGQPISCNHRVAQMASFNAMSSAKDASADDAAACAQVLTSFVDVAGCRAK
jgi:hypothetical protein